MKRVLCLLVTLLLAFSVFAAGLFDRTSESAITLAIDIADKISLNPYMASDSESVMLMTNLFEGLFEYDGKTSQPKAAIATSYSVSEDGLVWTFSLDENACFSNGERISADTFIGSWKFLKQGPLAGNLDFLKEAVAKDEHTLVVKLKYPVSYLPSLLCQPCLAAVNPDNSSAFSGAYVLRSMNENEIVLSKNAYYRGVVKTASIRILVNQDINEKFAKGEVQWSLCSVENAQDYIRTAPLYATSFFYFSAKEGPYADEKVRKALYQVIPWNLLKAIEQGILTTQSLVPESGAVNTDILDYKQLLEESGYSVEDLPVISIGVHRGTQVEIISSLLSQLWTRYLGLSVSVSTVPLTVYTADPSENSYDFCLVTWIADYLDPMAFLSLFKSDSSYNIANYSNSEYDSLLEQARTAEGEERQELLLTAEQILLDSCVVIPLSNALSTNFVRDDLISGWYENSLDIHPFKDLEFVN